MATPVWSEIEKRWRLDTHVNGRRRCFVSSKPGKGGMAEVRRKYAAAVEGGSDKAGWRVARCWDLYLEDVEKRTGKGENWIQRDKYGRLYILPEIGHRKVGSVTTYDWQAVINNAKPTRKNKAGDLIRKELSKKVLKNIMGTITDFCGFAMRSRMIETLPDGLYVPKNAPVIGKEIIQPSQLEAIYRGAGSYWYGYAWLLMIVTGWRPGEVLGLKYAEVDGEMLKVNQAVNSRRKVTDGKNWRARQKKHFINEFSREIIAAQKAKLAKKSIISPWLFPSEDAELPNPHRSYKQWKAFTATLGINVPPYSMRHTHVSIMKELPIGWLKTILGHGADMDTFGIYGHVVDGEIKEASIKTAEILKRHIKTS